jgi:hypothetical protein
MELTIRTHYLLHSSSREVLLLGCLMCMTIYSKERIHLYLIRVASSLHLSSIPQTTRLNIGIAFSAITCRSNIDFWHPRVWKHNESLLIRSSIIRAIDFGRRTWVRA